MGFFLSIEKTFTKVYIVDIFIYHEISQVSERKVLLRNIEYIYF